jgi:hypothetical protein
MNRLLHWLNRFNREKITLLIGSLALVLGAISPWYHLPPPTLEAFGINLAFINIGRAFAALLALLGFAFLFRSIWGGDRRSDRLDRTARLLVWSGLIAALLFPYLITTFAPAVTLVAKAYYEQGQQVGKHVEINFPQVQAQWKQNISLEPSSPVKSIFFSIKDSRFFQMSSWDDVWTRGLGYSNHFFGFIGQGWVLTVIGLVIVLTAFYLAFPEQALQLFLTDAGSVLPWSGLVFGLIICSLIAPNLINYQLDTLFAKGEYHQVIATSQALAVWYPPLREDEAFLQRLAEASFYGNEPDPALIDFAKGLERYRLRDFLAAEAYFQRSLALQPQHFLVREYLATAMLNQGVQSFNQAEARKPAAAIDQFEAALQVFPGHLEALYDLMLARVVNGEFEQSAAHAQQLIQTLHYFHKPSFALLGQAYLHAAWASYHDGNLPEAWKQYRQSIDNSTWDKPINDDAVHSQFNHEMEP